MQDHQGRIGGKSHFCLKLHLPAIRRNRKTCRSCGFYGDIYVQETFCRVPRHLRAGLRRLRKRALRLRRNSRHRLRRALPEQYGFLACAVTEIVTTCIFLLVICGATDKLAPAGFGPLAIGLCLTLIHLVSIPVTNTSVNPARSTAVAIFQGDWALGQLWFFWVMPIIGAVIGGLIYRYALKSDN